MFLKILTLQNKRKGFNNKAMFDGDDGDDEGLTHGVAVHGSPPRVSCVMLVILRAQFGGRHRLRTDHPHFTSHETRLDKNTRQRRYKHSITLKHTHTTELTKTTHIPEVKHSGSIDITAKDVFYVCQRKHTQYSDILRPYNNNKNLQKMHFKTQEKKERINCVDYLDTVSSVKHLLR